MDFCRKNLKKCKKKIRKNLYNYSIKHKNKFLFLDTFVKVKLFFIV